MSELERLTKKRLVAVELLDQTKAERQRAKAEIAKLQEAANASLAKVALSKLPGAATRQAEQKVKAEALAIQAEELDRRVDRIQAEIAQCDQDIKAAERAGLDKERLAAIAEAADKLAGIYPDLVAVHDKHKAFVNKYGPANTPRPPYDLAGLIGLLAPVMRQQEIKAAMAKNKRQTVTDLAKAMHLPDRTVRRELVQLGYEVIE